MFDAVTRYLFWSLFCTHTYALGLCNSTYFAVDMCMYFKNIIASGHGYVTRNHSQNPTSGIVKKDVVDATKTLGCGSKKDHCGVELDVSPLVSIFPEEPISFLRACLQVCFCSL